MKEKTISICLMQDNSEVIPYDRPGIPIYIRSGWLSMYTNMRSRCHWHEDLEFIRVHDGSMCYWINGKTLLLEEGDCLFVNTRQMHYGYSYEGENCNFTCIILHPSLLCENRLLRNEYVDSLLKNTAIEYFQYSADNEDTKSIRDCLDGILFLKRENPVAYELMISGIMGILIGEIYRLAYCQSGILMPGDHPDTAIHQTMVSYIYQHYTERIGLSDIAQAGNVCRNKCCQIFSKHVHQPPVDFLNHYRLEVSRNLLDNTDWSIIRIAQSCGFNHSSYYSKLFRRAYHCTPMEYRNNGIGK